MINISRDRYPLINLLLDCDTYIYVVNFTRNNSNIKHQTHKVYCFNEVVMGPSRGMHLNFCILTFNLKLD